MFIDSGMLNKTQQKKGELKMTYKQEKQRILLLAGKAQHTYWTTKHKQYQEFPNTNITIGEATSSPEGEAKWEQGMKDMETPAYKAMDKICFQAQKDFEHYKADYKELNDRLVQEGILKRGLGEFMSAMFKMMPDRLSAEMANAKWECLK